MKTGRNERCPCGSGKKWKKCCGLVAPTSVAAPADTEPAAPVSAPPGSEPLEPAAPVEPEPRGGRDWTPLQHQSRRLRPSNFGRKKAR